MIWCHQNWNGWRQVPNNESVSVIIWQLCNLRTAKGNKSDFKIIAFVYQSLFVYEKDVKNQAAYWFLYDEQTQLAAFTLVL